MFALRTNTYIWKSPLNKYIDLKLEKAGFKLIDLPWENIERLKKDPDHFTWKGYKSFCKYLYLNINKYIAEGDKIHIIADSTIDHLNYNKKNKLTRKGNKYLKYYFSNYKLSIDALCGSGYSTLIPFNKRLPKDKNCNIIFIGGWNDTSFSYTCKSINNIINSNFFFLIYK